MIAQVIVVVEKAEDVKEAMVIIEDMIKEKEEEIIKKIKIQNKNKKDEI